MRLLEYTSLREEMAQNKKYIFERPLLIVTALGVALIQLEANAYLAIILPFLLIVTLWTNLVLTVNRLGSSSRIAAYILVVLEPFSDMEWIGWERALRQHRIWMEKNSDKLDDIYKEHSNPSAVPDSKMFYNPLVCFHLVIIAIAIVISLFLSYTAQNVWNLSWSVLSLATTGLFVYFYKRKYNFDKIFGSIERERIIWLAAFGKLE
jgi:hypothetical protein